MFKLVKILGKGNNVPEIITINAPIGCHVKKNAVYFITGDNISSLRESDVLVKFIPIEDLPEEHERKKVRGYIVTQDMIFEAPTQGDFSEKYVGDGFSFHEDSNNDLVAIMPDNGGDGTIISTDDYAKTGKVLVSFTTHERGSF